MQRSLNILGVLQDQDYDCGAAASMTVGRYLHLGPATLPEWYNLVGTTTDGTSPNSIIAAFRSLGAIVSTSRNTTIADLPMRLQYSIPVIALIQGDYGDHDTIGHYVVIVGADSESQSSPAVHYLDPAVSITPISLPQSQFLSRWHDCGSDGTIYWRYGIAVSRG